MSNSEFYENRLFIIPSPYTSQAGMGLRFHPVVGGVFYSEAKSSEAQFANPVEAREVAEAVLQHARAQSHLSLGVATFSMKQRRAIQDELEVLRRANPDTEPFFHAHPGETFFLKNLENVQGDERDVIFISVGYGRDPEGRFAMRFGPLGTEGGERRLNVLISRAKQRCEVFASITDEDIDLERARGKGVFALKLFLHFARTGRLDMTHRGPQTPSTSRFAAQVGAALEAQGYQVHPNVGIAGCFLDLAVLDPELPGRYLLGIECDGPSYHEAHSARDRDRLRSSVLEDHGWLLHRVWSIDWLHRPKEQLERLTQAIDQARTALKSVNCEATAPHVKVGIVTVERGEITEIGLKSIPSPSEPPTQQYEEARLSRPALTEFHETPTILLTDLVVQIVAIEGPIHVEEVLARLRSIWGLQRSGTRVQSTADRAIKAAVLAGTVQREDRILSLPGKVVVVRDRSAVESPGLRRVDLLPGVEIETAVLDLIDSSFGAEADQVVRAVSRKLGYAATSALLRQTLLGVLSLLEAKNAIVRQGDLYLRQTDHSKA